MICRNRKMRVFRYNAGRAYPYTGGVNYRSRRICLYLNDDILTICDPELATKPLDRTWATVGDLYGSKDTGYRNTAKIEPMQENGCTWDLNWNSAIFAFMEWKGAERSERIKLSNTYVLMTESMERLRFVRHPEWMMLGGLTRLPRVQFWWIDSVKPERFTFMCFNDRFSQFVGLKFHSQIFMNRFP